MRVIIAGPRIFDDREPFYHRKIEELTDKFESKHGTITSIVCGKARGIDTVGEQWAIRNGIHVDRFPPDWKKLGKAAGPIRNVQMGQFADGAIILWDGKSRGTKHMRDVMVNLGKPFILDIIEPIHYNYDHRPDGSISQHLGSNPFREL